MATDMLEPRTYRVANVHEGLALARKLQQEGRYDWFRGQTVNWRLRATMARRSEEQREKSYEVLGAFDIWCQRHVATADVLRDVDAVAAIAQHYGLDTWFLDFTLDPAVAAFFATDGDPKEIARSQAVAGTTDAVILLLDTKDMVEFFDSIADVVDEQRPAPRLVRIDVQNLWRLQTQKGVFLECPFVDFEADYRLDRILFPYQGPQPDLLDREYIYPKDKSKLEELLDHYFEEQRMKTGYATFWEAIHDLQKEHPGSVMQAKAPHPYFNPKFVQAPERLTPAPGWDPDALEAWRHPAAERYDAVRSDEVCTIDLANDARDDAARAAKNSFRKLLSGDRAREHLVEFRVRAGAWANADQIARTEKALRTVWNGLRNLPYASESLEQALVKTLMLAFYCAGSSGTALRNAMSGIIDEPFYVEFFGFDGSYNRGFVATRTLLAAVRRDVGDILAESVRSQASNPKILLQVLYGPATLFEFGAYAKLFAEEVVPTQVALRPKEPPFFSPLGVHHFGLP